MPPVVEPRQPSLVVDGSRPDSALATHAFRVQVATQVTSFVSLFMKSLAHGVTVATTELQVMASAWTKPLPHHLGSIQPAIDHPGRPLPSSQKAHLRPDMRSFTGTIFCCSLVFLSSDGWGGVSKGL